MTGSAKQSIARAVIASEAKQSILPRKGRMDCFAALAMTVSGRWHSAARHTLSRHRPPTGRANARPMTGSAKQSIARAVIASAAKQSILPRKERMDCFAALAMTTKRTFTASRRDAPEALLEFSAQRGRGKRCTFAWAAAKLPKAPGSQKRLSEDFSSLRLTRASVPAAIVATQSVRHRSPVAEERPNFSPWFREAIAA